MDSLPRYVNLIVLVAWPDEALKELDMKVIQEMNKGYEPLGGAQLIKKSDGSWIATQTLVLKTNSKTSLEK